MIFSLTENFAVNVSVPERAAHYWDLRRIQFCSEFVAFVDAWVAFSKIITITTFTATAVVDDGSHGVTAAIMLRSQLRAMV